ncbi:Cell death specification protein 2 [Trichinella britovi]|uniref:Cell death specification protein 2 n=2 Tax=Trichinella TaxID=6333 RepID=A0A0V1CGC4_TRIBR|nr:Cell death specification protein 2 [Trichinella murrelli]KRY48242.1 Cell death specification protein 2 [Trichinella britovi]KRZ86563.1 Cell death specification protein 2 [Trichinella sp. T8]
MEEEEDVLNFSTKKADEEDSIEVKCENTSSFSGSPTPITTPLALFRPFGFLLNAAEEQRQSSASSLPASSQQQQDAAHHHHHQQQQHQHQHQQHQLQQLQQQLINSSILASAFAGEPQHHAMMLAGTSFLAMSALQRRRRADAKRNQHDQQQTLTRKQQKSSSSSSSDSTKAIVKDEAYWERRRRNNEAAKRSRDARRAKEEEIALRAAMLEQENLKLKAQLNVLKNETARLHCLLLSHLYSFFCVFFLTFYLPTSITRPLPVCTCCCILNEEKKLCSIRVKQIVVNYHCGKNSGSCPDMAYDQLVSAGGRANASSSPRVPSLSSCDRSRMRTRHCLHWSVTFWHCIAAQTNRTRQDRTHIYACISKKGHGAKKKEQGINGPDLT